MTELSHWALLYREINNGNMSWSGFTFSSCFFVVALELFFVFIFFASYDFDFFFFFRLGIM